MKPLSFIGNHEFYYFLLLLDIKDNEFLVNDDIFYSIYELDGIKRANFETRPITKKTIYAFLKATYDDDSLPVKTGFSKDEKIIWGLWRKDTMIKILIEKTFFKEGKLFGIIKLTNETLDVKNNLYYSLEPTWKDKNLNIEIEKPVFRTYTFQELFDYKKLLPSFSTNYTFLVNGKEINNLKYKPSKEEIESKYLFLTIKAKAFVDSGIDEIERIYKFYWN